MSPYPNIHQIEEIFALRCHSDRFNQYLADPIDITVVGQDFHAGGNYRSVQGFHENVYLRIAAPFKAETIRVEVRRVIGGGETSWAAVDSLFTAESKYGKKGRKQYAFMPLLNCCHALGRPVISEVLDLVRFDSNGKIAQMKEFCDSGHLHGHVEEHESKTRGDKVEAKA